VTCTVSLKHNFIEVNTSISIKVISVGYASMRELCRSLVPRPNIKYFEKITEGWSSVADPDSVLF
jgi:hypothetical protein